MHFVPVSSRSLTLSWRFGSPCPPFHADFNHVMELQMAGLGPTIISGDRDPISFTPDPGWVERRLADPGVKMVVVTNPCNPTGTVVPQETLQRISDACEAAGTWLVLDNTYEYFVYGDHAHHTIDAPHVINLFSFSKAHGMMVL